MSTLKNKSNPKIFISYSHDSKEHLNEVLNFSNKLRADGVDSLLDQYEECPTDGWPKWIDKSIRDAEFTLLICTKKYYERVMGDEKKNIGLGIKWEGALIYQYIYESGSQNTRFIPIIFKNEDVPFIPMPLRSSTFYNYRNDYEKLYRRITNQIETKKEKLGKLKSLNPLQVKTNFFDLYAILQLNGAITKKDYERINQLLDLGIDLNCYDDKYFSPLELAIMTDDVNMVKYLLSNGADVNLMKHDNTTPIINAIMKNSVEIVKVLLEYGANIHIKNKYTSSTPLALAIACGNFEIVKLMKNNTM